MRRKPSPRQNQPRRPGEVVFLSNSPTPNQIDLFSTIAASAPVTALFTNARETDTNVAWKLKYPAWVNILPRGAFLERLAAMRRLLKGKKPGLVMLGGYQSPLSWWLLTWGRLRGAPVYFWFERPMPASPLKAAIRSFIHALILPLASGILAVDSQAETYYRYFNKNIHRLPYAINPSRYSPRPVKARKGPIKFLFVGQFINRKSIAETLEAFQTIKPTQARLTIAGVGPQQNLVEAFCKKTGHQYIGFVQPTQLPALFAAHDVFVMPSKYDGWGIVVTEAMACGLPIISTPAVGAFADLNPPGKACAPTPTGIRAAVQYYINNRHLIGGQGAAARKIFLASRANAQVAAKYLLARLARTV